MKVGSSEYKKKLKELRSVAMGWMQSKTPDEGMELASRMDPLDAYLLGRIIGGAIQADIDMKSLERAFKHVGLMVERRGEIQNGRYLLN